MTGVQTCALPIFEPGLADTLLLGDPTGKRYGGDTTENVSFIQNKVINHTSSYASSYIARRTNYIRFSERFDYSYWTKYNVAASTGTSTMAGLLPYRNPTADQKQLGEDFLPQIKNYYTGYAQSGLEAKNKNWYQITPLYTRHNFTSNAIVDLYESNVTDGHYIQTFGYATSLNSNFFASSVYASPANGVTRFRMQVGNVYADFDLNAVAVIKIGRAHV